MDKPGKQTVLFLCTGNSCRSQMAEALTNQIAGGSWTAYSAGTDPAGYVHPTALKVLEEIGITHLGESKSVNAFIDQDFDLVVIVCDQADENCPLWLRKGKLAHQGFRDPAAFKGTQQESLREFRTIRNQIRQQIPLLLARYQTKDKS